MNWENLKNHHCPYCGEHLVKDDLAMNMNCAYCRFTISMDRFKLIAVHRSQPKENDHPKMKWQNLIDDKCPLCGQELMEEMGRFEIAKCVNLTCDFRIRQDKLRDILQDPDHPANVFYRK